MVSSKRRKGPFRIRRHIFHLSLFKALNFILLVSYWATLLGLCTAEPELEPACIAPLETNFNSQPDFWCGIKANITVGFDCTTSVVETITFPWTHSNVYRWIPHQENQTLSDIFAYREDDEKKTPLLRTLKEENSTKTNKLMQFRTSLSQTPVSIVVQYKVTPGVLSFKTCVNMKFELPDVSPPENHSIMVTKWAIGGLSVKVNAVEVTFTLADTSKVYLDSPVNHPKDFVDTTSVSNKTVPGTVSVTHKGSSALFRPGAFLFYMRFGLLDGAAECPETRNCLSESGHLSEGEPVGVRRGKIVGIGVGSAVAIVAVVALLVMLLRKQRDKAGEIEAETGTMGETLPDSLRHFEYDTGDQSASQKWEQWMEGTGRGGGEINAADLSPRNQPAGPSSIESRRA